MDRSGNSDATNSANNLKRLISADFWLGDLDPKPKESIIETCQRVSREHDARALAVVHTLVHRSPPCPSAAISASGAARIIFGFESLNPCAKRPAGAK